MHIGMPTGGERNPEPPGINRAEQAKLAGSGDVNDVGAKPSERLADGLGMAKEEGIEREVLLHAYGPVAAVELQDADASLLHELVFEATGANAKHGDLAALSKGDEMTRRVRYAVHLVKTVREERDARHAALMVDGRETRMCQCGISAPN